MQRMSMTPLALLAALLAMATAANATPFASGKLYGGPTQNKVTCYILNSTAKSVSLSSVRIISEAGSVVAANSSCGATLGAHMGCATQSFAVISITSGYDCSTDATLATGLRGSIEVRSNSGTLQVQPMR